MGVQWSVAKRIALFVGILAVVVLGYVPGLYGDFLLDDYQNLKTLSGLNSESGLGDYLYYSLTDVSGPLGRPISLLSFAFQHRSWPADPFAFKALNLAIHLATGTFLAVLFHRLASLAGVDDRTRCSLTIIASALWLLTPMHVSTVLYVVQRMAQLAALFSVASILAWIHGRVLIAGARSEGWLWIVGIAGPTAMLAVLSKETGLLVPIYIVVLESTILRVIPMPARLRFWRAVPIWIAVVVVFGAITWHFWDAVASGYGTRDFTLGERLLTQPRVVANYLRMSLMPDPAEFGLFHDDIEVSRDWRHPASTVPAILALGLFFVSALVLRRKVPVLSFGVLWFLGGHALESTILPLEIYFEHRNYLPLAGPYFALAHTLVSLRFRVWLLRSIHFGSLVAVGWVLAFFWLTWAESHLWGNPLLQAVVWAQRHPGSARAQERLASVYAARSEFGRAATLFRRLGDSGYPAGYLSLWLLTCYGEPALLPPESKVLDTLSTSAASNAPIGVIEQIIHLTETGDCPDLAQPGMVIAALKTMQESPRYRSKLDALYYYEGRWRLARKDLSGAVQAFEEAYRQQPSTETALILARLALAARDRGNARKFLEAAKVRSSQRLISPGVAGEFEDLDMAIRRTWKDE